MSFVTVLMPARNAEKYIAEAIRSVLDQTYSFFELLIVNDGSGDRTAAIVGSFTDPRIRLLNQPYKGISAALNHGLQSARGEYIARFDADDVCLPQRLEMQVGFLNENPDYILVGSDAEYVQENGEHLFDFHSISYTHDQISKRLFQFCPFIHSSVMYRKNEVLAAGGYSPYAHHFEDYLLWVTLLHSGKCCNLPLPLIKVRFNPDSLTIDEKWRGENFRKLKMKIIQKGSITAKEGSALNAILEKQQGKKIKEGSYHALCCKKFLADNYQPAKARWHAAQAIYAKPFRLDNYAMLVLSYLPENWIRRLSRRQMKNTMVQP